MAQNHKELLEAFAAIPDRQERLAAIVDRARRGAPLALQNKTAAQRVSGCVSPVWLSAECRDGRIYFNAEAEAPVVNGLVRLLCELYDGATPSDVRDTEPTLLEDLELLRDLSPTRRNGLVAVRKRIKEHAQQCISTTPS